jgi:hypothetical protein
MTEENKRGTRKMNSLVRFLTRFAWREHITDREEVAYSRGWCDRADLDTTEDNESNALNQTEGAK